MGERALVPARDDHFYLLQAHRQPLAENVAAAFIEELSPPNGLVIDPFVGSDAGVRAALGLGRRILAADSNPLVAWVARTEATLPGAREIKNALARFGDTPRDGETLRAAVEKLYLSVCGECGGQVVVDSFVHRQEGDKTFLTHKNFVCEQCGVRREDATEADRQRAADAAPRGMHYHLLVQRLLSDDAAFTPLIKRLLALYTPRNLNALALVTQKLDAEYRDDPARNVLAALLLHALDIGTSLYASRAAQPTRELPAEFVEVNIWRALAEAADGLAERPAALRLATTPSQVLASSAPAAFIGQGGARYLADSVASVALADPVLILTSPARLDPSFWEWSFLWTRWLLGKNAAVPLQPLLEEKNQRWGWYGEALTNAFGEMARLAGPATQCVVAFPSGSHAMVEALMLAASPVFALEDFTFRPHRGATDATEWGALRGDYQVTWKWADAPPAASPTLQVLASRIRATSLEAARAILGARGEPLAYSWLHHAALDRLAREGVLRETLYAKHRPGDNAFQFLRHRMEEGFKEGYIQDLDHWEEKGRVLWMRREEGSGASLKEGELDKPGRGERKVQPARSTSEGHALAERVELAVRGVLERKRTGIVALEDELLRRFPGLLTAEIELVELCAGAFADLDGSEWVWRDEDEKQWRARAAQLITALGERLGFQTVEPDSLRGDMVWRLEKVIPGSAKGSIPEERVAEDAYAFVFRSRVDLYELVAIRAAPLRGLVVIPETRVELTREVMRREPRWGKKLERAGWEFMRMPMLELLLREDYATRPEFQLAWGLEPALAQGQEQLQLL